MSGKSINDVEFTILMSEISMEINDTKTVSDEKLFEFRDYAAETAEYKENMLYAADVILVIAEGFLMNLDSSVTTIVKHYKDLIEKIRICVYDIDVEFYAAMFKYHLSDIDGKAQVADKIVELERIMKLYPKTINIFKDIDRKRNLLALYMLDPYNNIDKVPAVSASLKELLEAKKNLGLHREF